MSDFLQTPVVKDPELALQFKNRQRRCLQSILWFEPNEIMWILDYYKRFGKFEEHIQEDSAGALHNIGWIFLTLSAINEDRIMLCTQHDITSYFLKVLGSMENSSKFRDCCLTDLMNAALNTSEIVTTNATELHGRKPFPVNIEKFDLTYEFAKTCDEFLVDLQELQEFVSAELERLDL